MKIFTVDKIREADQFTIKNEPISSLDLMERASVNLSNFILNNYSKKYHLFFICGKGNNAGDGLAMARILSGYGYRCAVFLALGKEGSEDFNTNLQRLEKAANLKFIESEEELIKDLRNSQYPVCVDALFGSGLSRAIEGDLANLIIQLNKQDTLRIAIDMPSGLFADKPSKEGAIFKADVCLTIQFVKLALLTPENEKYVGSWHLIEIGLHPDYIQNTAADYHFYQSNIIPQHSAFAHKGIRGRVMVIAGGYGRMGAAIMTTQAALRSGAGLVKLQCCKHCVDIAQNTMPEALIALDENEYALGDLIDVSDQDALVIGPALGFAEKTKMLVRNLLKKQPYNLVLDADALTILSENEELMAVIPKGTVITPHIGEFDRLFGKSSSHFERIEKMKSLAKKHQIIIVLKGKYTAVCNRKGEVYFNSTGNDGMGKGGSGDVLTGIIGAYLCQFEDKFQAVLSAVHLHGKAGDICADLLSKNSMLPTDLVKNLHQAENN